MSDTSGRIVITLIAIALTALVYYLTKRKLEEPDWGFAWGGVIFVAFFALLFLALTALIWWGVQEEEKRTTIDAEFISIESDGIAQTETGDTIFYWKLNCRWRHPISGETSTLTSAMFEGRKLFYNRHALAVNTNAEQAGIISYVDLSYLSKENKNGIPIITENEVQAAIALHKFEVAKRRNSKLGKWLQGPLDYFERNKGLFTLLSVVSPILIFFGVLFLWWWRTRGR